MQFKKAHALTLAISALIGTTAHASQADSQGFIEDSQLTLKARNFFIDNNNRDIDLGRREWGQSLLLNYTSGYTLVSVSTCMPTPVSSWIARARVEPNCYRQNPTAMPRAMSAWPEEQ